jgi:hemerythrin-like metal-binding protein
MNKLPAELELGIAVIDEQHLNFVQITEDLKKYMDEGKSQEKMTEIFDRLSDYANYHFETEEKYFTEFGYENTKEHIREHKKFKEDLQSLIARERSGDKTTSIEIIFFLEDWLKNHVANQDRKYVDCFLDHGLK